MKKQLFFLLCSLLAAFNIHAQTGVGYLDSWPKPNGAVRAIVRSGNTVYIGGLFTSVDGQPRNKLAAIDATTGTLTSWNPNAANLLVQALAVSGNTVYVGGGFTSVGGQPRNNIAAIDATTGNVTSWNPNANNAVVALAVSGNTVYAGGSFTTVGGQSRNTIAAIDATTGTATSWDPNSDGGVYALVVSGNTVYAGGTFTSIGGQTRNKIAALDITTGTATTWNPNANGYVYALAVSGNTVYAGGQFTAIGGQNRNYIAALEATTSNAIAWNPNVIGNGGGGIISALAVSGNTVYAGGSFTTISGQSRNNVAAIDATTGIPTSWDPNVSGSISALAVSGSTVYAGGQFTSMAGDTSRKYFMALRDSNTVLGVSPTVLEEGFSFSAFPNPAGEKVLVRSNGAVSQSAVVQIMSIMGAAVKEQHMQNGQAEIDLNGVASGIYLLRYKDGEGRTGIVRLVKQ